MKVLKIMSIGLPVRSACAQNVEIFIHLMTAERFRQIEK